MIGDRIKILRQRKGYNMRQMASALNMPYTTYVNYEKGVREPNSEQLIMISKYFDVSIDFIMERTNDSSSPRNITIDYTSLDDSKAFGKKYFPKHTQEFENMMMDFDNLTDEGKSVAFARVHELTMIPKYSNVDEDYNHTIGDYTQSIAAGTGGEGFDSEKINEVNDFARQIAELENKSE